MVGGGCFHTGCRSGYPGECPSHLFLCPKEVEIRRQWLLNIPKRVGADFDFSKSRLCHLHFDTKYICKEKIIKDINGVVIFSNPYKQWQLTEDAVPTIFENSKVPAYYNKKLPKRKPPKERVNIPRQKKAKLNVTPCKNNNNTPQVVNGDDVHTESDNTDSHTQGDPIDWKSELIGTISSDINKILLPSSSWTIRYSDDKNKPFLLIFEFGSTAASTSSSLLSLEIIRNIQISHDLKPTICVKGKQLPYEQVKSLSDINNLIKCVAETKLCNGVSTFKDVSECASGIKHNNVWFSKKCTVASESKLCHFCSNLCNTLRQKRFRMKQSLKNRHNSTPAKPAKARAYYRKKLESVKQQLKKTRVKRAQDRLTIQTMNKQFQKIPEQTMIQAIDSCDEMPENTKLALKEAVKIAQQKSRCKGDGKHAIRYAPDWLLQSLLLKITSPKAYRFLRDNQVLPLPHPSTLHRLIRGLPCSFGFSDSVLELLAGEMKNKNGKSRHGCLLFDEMKVREALDFSKNDMSFKGFVDFGEFTDDFYKNRTRESLMADHALVLMFRPFNAHWVQPIAAFASKDAAPGEILSKLIVSAVIKLEACGALVDCTVSDGAKPNRNLWTRMGVSGALGNSVTNKFNGEHVCFAHYRLVHDEDKKSHHSDSNSHLRATPKLTEIHLNPNTFQKMVVSYATQLFSESVADAMRFYKDQNVKGLENSEGTIKFTQSINDLFDSLNARVPVEGLKLGSKKLKVIDDFSKMLDKEADANTFGSQYTLEGLRVTLRSVIDLIHYLISDVGFAYVLTAKFNQDCLEKFFGLVRSFNGDDDHPSIISFSYLYRLLSLYHPLSNLVKGNIRGSEASPVALTTLVDSLNESRRELELKNSRIRQSLKEEIMKVIVQVQEEEDDKLLDHNYSRPSTWLCKIFQLCGFLAFSAKKFTSCDLCLATLTLSAELENRPEAVLTNIKSNGYLKCPSDGLFNLIKQVEPVIESSFNNNVVAGDFLPKIVQEFGVLRVCNVGCETDHHRQSLLANLVSYYLTTRMYFYTRIFNKEKVNVRIKSKVARKKVKLI